MPDDPPAEEGPNETPPGSRSDEPRPDGRRTMDTVASADGTEIAVERTGEGPPLVLVHGAVCDHRFWELGDVRRTVANHRTVHAMDYRGVGQSDDAPTYEFAREFEDVAAVVDATGEPAALLGHSGGALLALEAARRTDNLEALVLYEPPVQLPAESDGKLEAVVDDMQALLDEDNREEVIVLFLQEIAQSTPEEIDAQRMAPYWNDAVDAAHVWLRHVEASLDYAFDADRFASLTTPTLLLTGSESPQYLRDATATVDEALPNSQIVTFDGHAHEAMLTAPDRFVEAVLSFVEDPNADSSHPA